MIPIRIDIEKLSAGFSGNRYRSINPHTPRQKLTTASAINNVNETFFRWDILSPLFGKELEVYKGFGIDH